MKKNIFTLALMAFIMASCGTHKTATDAQQSAIVTNPLQTDLSKQKQEYIQKVADNAVKSSNIVSKIDLTIDAMGKNITVDGKIYMRKDEVIRIVISPFGLMEVGRLEFTPDYVLLVDRYHKEYVKATYNDLDFLKANGLDFYSLQSLFWNQLFVPGQRTLSDSVLKGMDVDINSNTTRNVTADAGKLSLCWATTPQNAQITAASVTYAKGSSQASTAAWEYGKFSSLGNKQFPTDHKLSFQTRQMKSSGKLSMHIVMGKLTEDSKWDSKYNVSDKYKQVSIENVLGQLMSL